MSAPHEGVLVWDGGLVAVSASASGTFARLFRCAADGVPEGAPLAIDAGARLALPPFYYAPFMLGRRLCGFWNPAAFAGGPEQVELACLSEPDDYVIHWPSNTPLFTGQTVLRLADLDAHLGVPPLTPNADGGPVRVLDQDLTPQDADERWLPTPDLATTPDGHVHLTLVRRSAATNGREPGRYQHTRWLVRLPPEARALTDLALLARPRWPLRKPWPSLDNPEAELGPPFYDATLDRLIFEANGQEFGNRRFTVCDAFGECVDDVPRGTAGALSRGFWVLEPDGEGVTLGYVSATDAYFGAARSYVQPGSTAPEGATLTRLGRRLAWLFSAPGLTPRARVLSFAPAHLDLDGDGLTATDEAALGTSDLAPNSDGDYVGDRVERDLGFDPADPTEAPIPADGFGALAVTTSALAQRRFAAAVTPDPGSGLSALVRSHAPTGPLCAVVEGAGRCLDAAGLEVARFGATPGARDLALAHDGRHLVTFTAEGALEALDLFTHERHELGAPPLPELDAGAELRVFPLDERVVYLARLPSLHPAVWVWRDGALSVALDLDAAALAAGFTTAPSSVVETMGLSYDHFQVLGFLDAPRRGERDAAPELVVAVQGHWRRYLVGLRPDPADPARVAARELMRTRLDGLGDVDVSAEWLGGLYLGGPLLAHHGGYVWPEGLRLFTGDTFRDRPVPAFGALFVQQLVPPAALVQPQQAGLHELVAFGPALAPGETLVFVSRWAGASTYLGVSRALAEVRGEPGMLFRVGPRGGMVPAWSLDPATFDYGFVEVSGLDLDRRHYLCLADRGADTLHVYRPTQSLGPPTVLDERLAVPGLSDCRWRADGGLSLLADGRVLTRPASAPRHELGAFAPEDHAGLRFVKGPGVDLELSDEATFVAAPEAGHARVSYDGATLATPWGALALEATGPTPPSIALRPDGRVVVVPDVLYDGERAEPLVIAEPSTPAAPTTYVALGDGARGRGLAVVAVPWAHLADPWTGARLDPADPFAPPTAPSFTPPAAPPAGVPAATPSPRPDEGCGGGPVSPLALLALALVAHRARRPHAG